jgi:citrate synthase
VPTAAGLEGVVVAETQLSSIDGTRGKLIYRGLDIHDLAHQVGFEEVAYLLWHGVLPTPRQLEGLRAEIGVAQRLPEPIARLLHSLPKTANPMDVLRTGVSALGIYDPDAGDDSPEANRRKALRLVAQTPALVAGFERVRRGDSPLQPLDGRSLAVNFLYMLRGEQPLEYAGRAIDLCLVLHADHGFNASTFAARVTAATLSDMHSAVTSAIGTLKGPLHGGANQRVMEMLRRIGIPDQAEAHVRQMLSRHERVTGFGHRVYKTDDPRATELRNLSRELSERVGDRKWFEMSQRIERLMLAERQLHANVDFYSASVYHLLGIPSDLFTPLFAISRMAGWTAHVLEQLANNRLIRPRAQYTGLRDQPFVPLAERDRYRPPPVPARVGDIGEEGGLAG